MIPAWGNYLIVHNRIDLYCCTGCGSTLLAETVERFDELVRGGQIRYWGVSNFDVADIDAVPGRTAVATDQVLYILARR